MGKKKVLLRIPLTKWGLIIGGSFVLNFALCYYYSLYYTENLFLTLWMNFVIQPFYFALLFSTYEFNKTEIVRYKNFTHYFKKRFVEQLGLTAIYLAYLFITMYFLHEILSVKLDFDMLLYYLYWYGMLFVLFNCFYIYSTYIGKRTVYEITLIILFILQTLFAMYSDTLRPYLFMAYPLYMRELNDFQMTSVLILVYLLVYWCSSLRFKEMGD